MNASTATEMNALTQSEVIGSIGGNLIVEPGVAPHCYSAEMTNEEYHSLPDSVSCSGLKEVLRSPAHYQAYLNNRREDNGINIGTALHCAVLEPHVFINDYVVYTGGRRAGKVWEEFKEQNAGKQIMSEVESAQVEGMVASVKDFADFPLWDAIRKGQSEKSIFWIDPETGIKCRMRADSLNPFTTFDLKTTDDARPEKFLRQLMSMNYDLQAAMYTEGVRHFYGKTNPFCFVTVEMSAPHGVFLMPAGETVIRSGMQKFRRALRELKKAKDTDNWRGYEQAVSVIELPDWMMRGVE